jgi:chromosome partitioning protein
MLVDADPQLSLGMWHERRGFPTNPAYTSAIEDRDLGRTIEQARNGVDWVIVDLPGSLMRTDVAIGHADLVVIPVRPSMLDIEAVNPICELADEAKVHRVFVLNAVDKDWKLLGSAIDALADLGVVLETSLRYHEGHASAMVVGSQQRNSRAHRAASPKLKSPRFGMTSPSIQRCASGGLEHERRGGGGHQEGVACGAYLTTQQGQPKRQRTARA